MVVHIILALCTLLSLASIVVAVCPYNLSQRLASNEHVLWGPASDACSSAVRLLAPAGSWRDSIYEIKGVSALPLIVGDSSSATGPYENITIIVQDCVISDNGNSGKLLLMNGTFTVIQLTASTVQGFTVVFVNVTMHARVPEFALNYLVHFAAAELSNVSVIVEAFRFVGPVHGSLLWLHSRSDSNSVDVRIHNSTLHWWGDAATLLYVVSLASQRRVAIDIYNTSMVFEGCRRGLRQQPTCPQRPFEREVHFVRLVARELNGLSATFVRMDVRAGLTEQALDPPASACFLFMFLFASIELLEHADVTMSQSRIALRGNLAAEVFALISVDFSTIDTVLRHASIVITETETWLETTGLILQRAGIVAASARRATVLRIRYPTTESVFVLCEHLHSSFSVISGVSNASVTWIGYAVATVFRINGNATVRRLLNSTIMFANVTAFTDVRNGTFTDSVFPGSGQGTIFACHSLVDLGQVDDVVFLATDSRIVADVGTNLTSSVPGGAMVSGGIMSTVAVLVMTGVFTHVTVKVANCSVRIASMSFGYLPSADSDDLSCFDVIGFNFTSIVSLFDINNPIRLCNPAAAASLPEVALLSSSIDIVSSVVDNNYAFERFSNADALVSITARVKNVSIDVSRSGAVHLSQGIAVVGCGGCSVEATAVRTVSLRHVTCIVMFAVLSTVVESSFFHDEHSIFHLAPKVPTNAPPHAMFTNIARRKLVKLENVSVVFQHSSMESGLLLSSASDRLSWDRLSHGSFDCVWYGGKELNQSSLSLLSFHSRDVSTSMVRCSDDAPPLSLLDTDDQQSLWDAQLVLASAATSVSTAIVVLRTTAPLLSATAGNLQLSRMVLRLSAACQSSDDNVSLAFEDIGSQWPDNPTGLELPLPQHGYAGGAILGNTLAALGGGCFIGVLLHVARAVYQKFCSSSSPSSANQMVVVRGYRRMFLRDAVACATAVYVALLLPTVAAAAALVAQSLVDPTGLVLFICSVGLLVVLVPFGVTLYKVVNFELVSKRLAHRRRYGCGVCEWYCWLVEPTCCWVVPSGRTTAAQRQVARSTLHYMHALIDPYRAGCTWVCAGELGVCLVQGAVLGVATHLRNDCTMARVCLCVLLGLSTMSTVLIGIVRPYSSHISTVQTIVSGILSSVVLVLELLGFSELSAVLTAVQSVISIMLCLAPTAVVLSMQLLVHCGILPERTIQHLPGISVTMRRFSANLSFTLLSDALVNVGLPKRLGEPLWLHDAKNFTYVDDTAESVEQRLAALIAAAAASRK